MAVQVTVLKDGPYKVAGDLADLALTAADGQPIDVGGKKAVFLCRCGASVNKPFCDGTHTRIGFAAAEAAVRSEAGA